MRYVELREMAYTRQIAISIMVGAEAPINEHLIKLFLLTDEPDARHHWVNELAAWYERIADIRLKPRNSVPPYQLFWDCLFANRFTPDGERPIQRILTRLARQYNRKIDVAPSEVLARLTQFHQQCCSLLAKGESPEQLLLAMEQPDASG
jgi:hypothetical protein